MTNFLQETIEVMAKLEYVPDEIVFIGSTESGHSIDSWEQFKELADFEYESGFGAQFIANDLVIVFIDDTYLTRYEYDGSECWEYHGELVLPTVTKPVTKLAHIDTNNDYNSAMWKSLESIQTYPGE